MNRRRVAVSVAAAVLALAGVAAIVAGFAVQSHAPTPPASVALPAARVARLPASSTAGPAGLVLPASVPTDVDVPAIGIHHSLIELGENPDGTLQVPPLSDVSVPGWDRYSPTPGQLGPSVLLGHVDSVGQGRGVFYDLGALRPGDAVSVTRADHTVAVFRVDGVNVYDKGDFPTLLVYGNTPDPQLRLITCGGPFDSATHHYLDNIVVFATLVGVHPA
jgi:hypothetical protein